MSVDERPSSRSEDGYGTFPDTDDVAFLPAVSPTNHNNDSTALLSSESNRLPDSKAPLNSASDHLADSTAFLNSESNSKALLNGRSDSKAPESDAMCTSVEDSINNGPLDDSSLNNLMHLSTASSSSGAVRSWYRHVTVEPVILMFSLAMTLAGPVMTALYLEHTCVATLGYNETYCSLLRGTSDKDLEAIVQPKANIYTMLATLVETCVPAVLTLFVGPWSDVHGRKTFLVLPVLGYFTKYAMCFAFSFYPSLSPAYLLTASVPVSLAGGLVSMISLSYCYITDITKEKRRGFRMGMVEAAFFTGLLVGTASSTYLFAAGGYPAVYATSAALCFITFLYGSLMLQESVANADPCKCLTGLFNVRLVKEMLEVCCKKRDYGRRAIIFLIVAALAVCVFSMEGEGAVQFVFTRKKFAWDIKDYATFGSVNILLQIIGTVLGVSVLSAWLGLNDSPLALTSFALKILSSVLTAVSPSDWWMYLAAVVGMFGAFAGPLCRAILSKAVDPQDVGKVFSLLSSMEALTPLAAVPLYTLIYNATINTYPGAFYLVTAGIFALDFVLLGTVVLIQRVAPVPTYGSLVE